MCGKLQGHLPPITASNQNWRPRNEAWEYEDSEWAWEGGLGEMLGLKDWEWVWGGWAYHTEYICTEYADINSCLKEVWDGVRVAVAVSFLSVGGISNQLYHHLDIA